MSPRTGRPPAENPKNLQVKMTARMVQSVNMPIHTAIGPKPNCLHRKIQRLTRNAHIVTQEVHMENFTSPAALSP